MKAKHFFIIILLLTICSSLLSQNNNSDLSANYKQSKNLIDRFNKLRTLENLQNIEYDSVLVNVGKILLTDKTFKNSTGVYDEDSVRLLFYTSGIIDYQYEIQEMSNKDTATVLKDFLLADKHNYIRAGYYKYGNKHILLKTKSYLKFDHGVGTCHSETNIDFFQNPISIPVYTDSIFGYFKILEPNEYYCQFYYRIPLSTDNIDFIEKKKIQTIHDNPKYLFNLTEIETDKQHINPSIDSYSVKENKTQTVDDVSNNKNYDFVTRAIGSEIGMFMIISNKNNERVVVVK